MTTTLTTLELKVLEVLRNQDWFEDMPTANIKDLSLDTKIEVKSLRGVLTSLQEKGIVTTGEFPNGMTAFHLFKDIN
jgi:Fe2+ or Zn2+ uptake regulation protein